MSENALERINGDILIVDDDMPSLQTLSDMLSQHGYAVRRARDAMTAFMIINNAPPDLILLDVRMPVMDGYEFCQKLKTIEKSNNIPVLFLSALDETLDKVRGFHVGGVDYITKPFQVEEVLVRVRTHLNLFNLQLQLEKQNTELDGTKSQLQKSNDELEERVTERTLMLKKVNLGLQKEITERKQTEKKLHDAISEIEILKDQLQQENIYLKEEIKLEHSHADIIGTSNAITKVLGQAEQVAQTESTVLVFGETGTGKELLAREIHRLSLQRDRTMIKVNCAALPPTLIEGELFGREKGAYTGALTKEPGRFELADKSTIFLDEICELPLDLQSKILHVLEDGQFERLGSSRTISVNVRVIAATNRDLVQMVRAKKFREDLYYRLNVFPITIPPLRDRVEDIPALVWNFVKILENSMAKRIESIPHKCMKALKCYPWPGNIRELRNAVEQAMITSSGKVLQLHPPPFRESIQSEDIRLESMVRRHIIEILNTTGWRVKGKGGAAEILDLKPTTLYSKMNKLGMTRPDQ